MNKSKQIGIIDLDSSRAEQLKNLIDFVGKSAEVLKEADAVFVDQDPEDFLCLIISSELPAKLLMDIANWDPLVPVLVVGVESISFHDAPIQQQLLGCFTFPPSYTELESLLHQCEICRDFQQKGKQDVILAKQIEDFVGLSQPIQQIRHLIAQVAKVDSNVLITGESGTGKEVVARNLHLLSKRSNKAFVPVNCGAIPAELLESELFGHEKGAFTGAITARQGRFELAEGGTIFLDEIGDMPLNMQVKLLRVLQEKTFERVGSNKTINADVRILAATHRNLEQLVEEGKFREDLYYRLNVFPIEMPALRDREEDIPILVNEIVKRFERSGQGSVKLSKRSLESLMQHDWPGNIRELFNLIERLIILHPSSIVEHEQLPEKYRHLKTQEQELPPIAVKKDDDDTVEQGVVVSEIPDNFDLKEHLSQLEIEYIKQALDDNDWVVARAAESLGMRRTTLVEKMRKYDLQRHQSSSQSSVSTA